MSVGRVIWYLNERARSLLYPIVSDMTATMLVSRMVSAWWVRVKYCLRMAAVSIFGRIVTCMVSTIVRSICSRVWRCTMVLVS